MKKYMALAFIFACMLCLISCNSNTEEASNTTGDYPPMVMFNDILFSAADDYIPNKDELIVVGRVESFTDSRPAENNQANDNLVGCNIYSVAAAPDHIFVLYNDVYSPYKAPEGEGFSYFDGLILEIQDTHVLVECLEVTNGIVRTGTQAQVFTNALAAGELPELAEGAVIRVVFGATEDTIPLRVGNVFAIYCLDENGDVLFPERSEIA